MLKQIEEILKRKDEDFALIIPCKSKYTKNLFIYIYYDDCAFWFNMTCPEAEQIKIKQEQLAGSKGIIAKIISTILKLKLCRICVIPIPFRTLEDALFFIYSCSWDEIPPNLVSHFALRKISVESDFSLTEGKIIRAIQSSHKWLLKNKPPKLDMRANGVIIEKHKFLKAVATMPVDKSLNVFGCQGQESVQ